MASFAAAAALLPSGVLIPSLANGEVTDPVGEVSICAASAASPPFAAAAAAAWAAAVALVVLAGVVSCSLPKGVAGGLGGDTQLLLALGSAN